MMYRQKDRQIDEQIVYKRTDKWIDRQKNIRTERSIDRQTNRKTDLGIDRQMDGKTNRQTYISVIWSYSQGN
jgi:hypothetical protein